MLAGLLLATVIFNTLWTDNVHGQINAYLALSTVCVLLNNGIPSGERSTR